MDLGYALRAELRKLDPELPVPQFRTMQDVVSASVAERKFQLSLVLVFASIALVLACLGIFGVASYTVAQRRGEMGIRLALGATAGNLRLMVVRQGLMPVVVGLICGIVGSVRRPVDFGGRFAHSAGSGGCRLLHSRDESVESGSADRAALRIAGVGSIR